MPLHIVYGDITKMTTDAIVNAANTDLVTLGGGVCGAIFRAAGKVELQRECKAIGGCPTGNAVITRGYNLPAKFIIHAVGPIWRGGEFNEAGLLAQSYTNSLLLAREKGLTSIAFPLISAGIYGYPKDEALDIAVSTIEDFLLRQEMDVYLVIYDKEFFMLIEKQRESADKGSGTS